MGGKDQNVLHLKTRSGQTLGGLTPLFGIGRARKKKRGGEKKSKSESLVGETGVTLIALKEQAEYRQKQSGEPEAKGGNA